MRLKLSYCEGKHTDAGEGVGGSLLLSIPSGELNQREGVGRKNPGLLEDRGQKRGVGTRKALTNLVPHL